MGQMRVDGLRTTIAKDGIVTVPGEGENAVPVAVGKLTKDGQKWVAQKRDEKGKLAKAEAFPRAAATRWRRVVACPCAYCVDRP